jgi:hypothetical protein
VRASFPADAAISRAAEEVALVGAETCSIAVDESTAP